MVKLESTDDVKSTENYVKITSCQSPDNSRAQISKTYKNPSADAKVDSSMIKTLHSRKQQQVSSSSKPSSADVPKRQKLKPAVPKMADLNQENRSLRSESDKELTKHHRKPNTAREQEEKHQAMRKPPVPKTADLNHKNKSLCNENVKELTIHYCETSARRGQEENNRVMRKYAAPKIADTFKESRPIHKENDKEITRSFLPDTASNQKEKNQDKWDYVTSATAAQNNSRAFVMMSDKEQRIPNPRQRRSIVSKMDQENRVPNRNRRHSSRMHGEDSITQKSVVDTDTKILQTKLLQWQWLNAKAQDEFRDHQSKMVESTEALFQEWKEEHSTFKEAEAQHKVLCQQVEYLSFFNKYLPFLKQLADGLDRNREEHQRIQAKLKYTAQHVPLSVPSSQNQTCADPKERNKLVSELIVLLADLETTQDESWKKLSELTTNLINIGDSVSELSKMHRDYQDGFEDLREIMLQATKAQLEEQSQRIRTILLLSDVIK